MSKRTTVIKNNSEVYQAHIKEMDRLHSEENKEMQRRYRDLDKKKADIRAIDRELVEIVAQFADGEARTARRMAIGTGFTPQELGVNMACSSAIHDSQFRATGDGGSTRLVVEIDENGNMVGQPFKVRGAQKWTVTKRW